MGRPVSGMQVDGQVATVRFDTFDLPAYKLFLKAKALPECELVFDWRDEAYTLTTPARFASLLGAAQPERVASDETSAAHLFDYQAFIVEQALAAKRYAIWADTGLGKTAMFLDWARRVAARTDGGVLIISPGQIIEQTREQAQAFYGDQLAIERLGSRADVKAWCGEKGLAIVNPEKFTAGVMPELRRCAGVVLDESSILKSGGGTIKWSLIKSARGIESKLSCTATPAPNDTMEYASQAAFLEKLRSDGEILWTFFTRDKRGNFRVKPHARDAFYRFMAGWSIYLRSPAAYGFEDILALLPPPAYHEHTLRLLEPQRAAMQEFLAVTGRGLFDERLGVRERAKLAQIARGFIYEGTGKHRTARRIDSEKPAKVAELARKRIAAGRRPLVWTVYDEEAQIIGEHLADVDGLLSLHGATPAAERQEILDRFRAGDAPALISKAQLVGYGMNFQQCRAQVFSGFDDSFERVYQAVRRSYRFGQTETVDVDFPVVPELEGLMFNNVRRKEAQFEADVAVQETNYRRALENLL